MGNLFVYRDLSDTVWAGLDSFEGEMYARRQVVVALDDGRVLLAEAYVWRAAYLARLERPGWDFNAFLIRHREHFVKTLGDI